MGFQETECKLILNYSICLQLGLCPWLIFVISKKKDTMLLMEIQRIVITSVGKPIRIYKLEYKVLNINKDNRIYDLFS